MVAMAKYIPIIRLLVVMSCLKYVESIISTKLSRSEAYVDDFGRYQDVVVSVNLRISADEEALFLANLKERVTELSSTIYSILGLQFGTVTILVPSHWSSRNYTTAFNEAPESADIQVYPFKTTDIAYTQHIQGCGKQALHLAINSKYISSVSTKVLLHQWMHYRYGAFDEYPLPEAKSFSTIDQQKFYHSSRSAIEAVRCSLDIEAGTDCKITKESGFVDVNPDTSLPKHKCLVSVKPPAHATPSLMSNYNLENVRLLCNKSTHNEEAPNRQNRLCSRRSVMEVFEEHDDFVKLNMTGTQSINFSTPQFNVRRLRTARTVVIVLDTSRSMNGSRLSLAKQAIGSMIESVIEDYTKILIVEFDANPAPLYPASGDRLGELDSRRKRTDAINSLKGINTGHHTCIGCGLEYAYNITKKAGEITGAYFILLTDGKDTKMKRLAGEMLRRRKTDSFFLDIVFFTDEADSRLKELALDSGSAVFSATEYSTDLIDAFTEIITTRQNLTSQMIPIYSENVAVRPNSTASGGFKFEGHLGRLSEITFYWDATSQPHLTFVVRRENDGKVVFRSTASSAELGYVKAQLDKNGTFKDSKSLTFTYQILSNHPKATVHAMVTVNTRTKNSGHEEDGGDDRKRRSLGNNDSEYDQPYSMKAYVMSETNFTFTKDGKVPEIAIHAFFPPGSVPEAPSSVVATITVTDLSGNITRFTDLTLDLKDSGIMPDVIEGDGIYSAYFTGFDIYDNATYYVRVRATGPGFMRYASTGYFAVYVEPDLDVSLALPPAPVTDLQVMLTEPQKIVLHFTASGADLNTNQAHHYKVLFSTAYEDMNGVSSLSNAHSIIAKDIPSLPLHEEQLTVYLPANISSANATLWIAVTVVDEYGIESNISNLVSTRCIAEVPRDFPIVPIVFPPMLSDEHIYLIVGILASLLLIIIIIIVVIACRRNRKRTNDNYSDDEKIYQGSLRPGSVIVEDIHSDLYQQDNIYLSNENYSTYRQKPLPSTKKRVLSLQWKTSIKRLTKRKSKAPAPPPPVHEPAKHAPTATANLESKKPLKPTLKNKSSIGDSAERMNKKPMLVNTETMPDDLAFGEKLAQDLIQSSNNIEENGGTVSGHDVPL